MTAEPTERFSDRVRDYVRYRPGYPEPILDRLAARLPERPEVVDVGAGTGIFTEQMLRRGWAVHAVEPNNAMRRACVDKLGERPGVRITGASAAATGLPDACADAVVAAQAFHWFDPPAALREFERVLRPDGLVALVWNERQTDTTAFLRDYERLLQDFATDYRQVNHQQFDSSRVRKLLPHAFEEFACPNTQAFDFEGLRGRLLSSSYAPAAGHADHAPMLESLREIFDQHVSGNRVEFHYTTRLYTGRPV